WLAAAGLIYTACTIAFTWPLAAHLTDHVRAAPIYGWVDLDLHLWTLAWVSRVALTAPHRLFDANIFYPAHLTLAGSDHLLVTLAVWLAAVALAERPLAARRWLALGAGVAGVLAAVAGVSWPYLLRREGGAILAYSGALGTAFLTHWLGPGLLMRREHVYLGFVPLGLVALACLPPLGADRRRSGPVGRFLAVGLAGWVLCLGSHVEIAGVRVPLPYSWLAAVVP